MKPLCLLLFSFSVLSYDLVFSQDLPKIVPPSPETSALFRFQDYPMDYSTGLPQISIPLYEIKSGSLSVPVSMSYHASGCRVSDRNGPLGIGWSLTAGGMISRTIHGSVDFGTAGASYPFPNPFKVTNINITNDLAYLERIIHCDKNPALSPQGLWTDSEYDVFSYSFSNNGGKFIFKDIGNVKSPVLLPYKPYVITPHSNTSGLYSIDVVDDKGVFYSFSGLETAGWSQGNVNTSYGLKQIISADKADTITFSYAQFVQERVTIDQRIILQDMGTVQSGPPQPELENLETTNRDTYTISRLTQIKFSQGKVLFNLVSGSDLLDNIQIVNKIGEVVKTIKFNRSALHSLSELGYATSKLDNVIFQDNVGTNVEKYAFEYFPTFYTGINDGNSTQLNVRYQDWWGYYNASGQHDMVPYHSNLTFIYHAGNANMNYSLGNISANREPNLSALQSGVLKKITYPTGGSTEFVYENNKYRSLLTNQINNGPGLRVGEIKTSDNKGTVSIKTFKYGTIECGYGFIDLEPQLDKMKTEFIYDFFKTTPDGYRYYYRQRVFNSSFVSEISELAERPVIYSEVTVYNGAPSTNIGKTIYNFDRIQWGAAGLASQKWHIYDLNYWNNSSMVKQTDFKMNSNAGTITYQKRKVTVNSYTANTSEYVSGLHVQRLHVMPQAEQMVDQSNGIYPESNAVQAENIQIYAYSDYRIPVGTKNLTSVVDSLYNDDGSAVINTVSYSYNANQLLSSTTQLSSDGKTIERQTKYPFDYTGNTVLNQMSSPSLNMLNFPIEQNELKNGSPLKSTRTNYYNWGGTNPMIAPQTIEVKSGSNPYETRIHFYSYDTKGNPTSFSRENDISYYYIWDYSRSYPIAQVTNAQGGAAFTSFESDGTGNWNGVNSANIKSDFTGITGKKYYTMGGGTLTMGGLNASTTYIVSYWSLSGSCSVTGTSVAGWPKNSKSVTINGKTWNYWEHKVTGVSTIHLNGSVSIDELRLYPDNVRMQTFTYDPLIGVTSKTDENNTTEYYTYDGFGRLKFVRDFNGHILKTTEYNYVIK